MIRIAPQEAVELASHIDASYIRIADDISQLYEPTATPGTTAHPNAVCFHAGMVHGIRQERTRRHSAASMVASETHHPEDSMDATLRKEINFLLRTIPSDKTLYRIYRFVHYLWMQSA